MTTTPDPHNPASTPSRTRVAPVTVGALVARLDAVDVRADADALARRVDGVTRDSREVGPTTAFVAVTGARVDGHAFAAEVDAAVVVVEREVEVRPGAALVRVRSTKRALAQIAAAVHGDPGHSLAVVGVTGTNGKTTVTTLIEQACIALGVHVGRIGTTGNAIDGVARAAGFTTPEAPELQALLAEMRDEGCRVVAMEASSIGLAQHRVDGIPFAVAVFTNLTQDHLDFHGTMAEYQRAKARLFSELLRPAGGAPRAVVNADDPASGSIDAPADRWTFGFAPGADVHVASSTLDAHGTALVLRTPDGEQVVRSALVGRHNASNLAAAWAALRCLGEDPARITVALGAAAGAPGRLERVPDPVGGRLVLVDYAHSDDALANVIPTVRDLVDGTVWLVFGCGGDRDRAKRPKMGAVARRLADRIVVTSDNPRSEDPARIVDDILAGIDDRSGVHVELDREAAIRWALARAARGDAVLLAGKGHETYQEVAGERRSFDDRVVARLALEER